MYEKYLEQLAEAGKIRNLKERSINCYKNYVSYFLKYQNKNPEELTCQDVRTFLLVMCKNDKILIASNWYPASLVKKKFLMLTYSHIEYVFSMLSCRRNISLSSFT